MMNNTSDSCGRQVAQTSKELRLIRQQAQLLQGQLETALGQLEQKRKKKRQYKAVLVKETEELQAALVHKDVRIGQLNQRIDKVHLFGMSVPWWKVIKLCTRMCALASSTSASTRCTSLACRCQGGKW